MKAQYLTNRSLLDELVTCHSLGKCTNELASMFMLLADRISRKPWYAGYSFREDMVQAAATQCIAAWRKFDPKRSQNPFSFFTTTVTRTFQTVMGKEREQALIKEAVIIDNGLHLIKPIDEQ